MKSRMNLPIFFFIGFTSLLAGFGYPLFRHFSAEARRDTFRELSIVAKLKAERLSAFLGERKRDAAFIASQLGAMSGSSRASDDEIVKFLGPSIRLHGYSNILILDTAGNIRLHAGRQIHLSDMGRKLATRSVKDGVLCHLHFADPSAPEYRALDTVAPIYTADGSSVTGVVLLRGNWPLLFELMEAMPARIASAESFVVRRDGGDVLFMSEVKNSSGESVRSIPFGSAYSGPVPSILAVQGIFGESEGVDYRGIPTLAFSIPVPETDWSLIIKEDTAVATSEVRFWFKVGILTIFGIGGLLSFLSWSYLRIVVRNEQLLQLSEARLNDAQRLARVGSWELNLMSNAVTWSPEIFRILELDPCETHPSYDRFVSLIHPEDAEAVDAAFREAVATNSPYQWEHRILLDNDRVKYVEERAVATYSASGVPLRAIGTIQDITARKEIEQALNKQTAMNQALFTQAMTPFAILDRSYRFVQVNESYAHCYGRPPAQLIGSSAIETLRSADETAESLTALLDAVVISGKPMRFTNRRFVFPHQPNRESVYLDSILEPILDDRGQVEFIFFSSIDVTIRNRAEGAIRDSEQRFRQVTENIDEVFWLTDVEKKEMVYVSPAYERIWGRTRDSLYESPGSWMESIHEAERTNLQEQLSLQVVGKYDVEYRIRRPDGAMRWIHDRAFPIKNESGETYRIAGVAADVTERRQAEEGLRLFRALIDQVTDAIIVIDPATGRYLDVNDKACQAHGFTREEYLTLTIGDLESLGTGKGDWREHFEGLRQAGSTILETRHRRKDGSMFPAEVNITYIELDRDYFVAIVRDITERNLSELSLRESEEKFRQLAEKVEHVLWLSAGYRLLYVSPAYESVFCGKVEDAYEDPLDFIKSVVPDDRERVLQALSKKADFDEEFRMAMPGGQIKWIWARTFNFHVPGSGEDRSVGIAQDVTEKKLAVDTLRESLEKEKELNKLKSDFISMVSHQFRTPLTTIQSSIEILAIVMQEISGTPAAEFDLHSARILAEVKRITELMEDVMAIGKTKSGKYPYRPEQKDILALLQNVVRERFEPVFPNRRTQITTSGEMRPIKLDEGLMVQVFSNLLSNAYKYSNQDPEVFISFADKGTEITFSDRGIGIPQEEQSRIFEPFFRAGNTLGTPGTGLGLSIVREFVELHGGSVSFASKPGQRSVFTIFLPDTMQ